MQSKNISLCMIVNNEEDNIGKCLNSIKSVVDEIIVIDTGSTDKTKEIAFSMGAKVFDFEWTDNFSEARNFSLSKASCDWILILDADEVISPEDHERIRELVKVKDEIATLPSVARDDKKGCHCEERSPEAISRSVAYSFITRNYIDQEYVGWIANNGSYKTEEAGIGWVPTAKVRLFPNDRRIKFENRIHEFVEPTLHRLGIKIYESNIVVHHYGLLNSKKREFKKKFYYLLGKTKLEEKGKQDLMAIYELAVTSRALGKYDEALKYWEKFIAIKDDVPTAFSEMATNYFLTGRYEEALLSLKKALQLDPNSADIQKMYRECEIFTYFERGNKLSNKGLFNEAISYYQKVIELDPNFAGAYHNLGKILQQQGYIDEAIRYYQKAIDLNPNFASFFNLAELFSYKRMLQEALEYYFKALQINTDNEWVYFKIAAILQSIGYIEDSIKYYKKSLQVNPNFAIAYNNLGNALRSQKNLDEAMQCYLKASEIEPAFIEAKYNIGTTLGEQGRIKEAEIVFNKILKNKPDYLLARWAKCMSQLPVIYLDESEIHLARKAYHEELIKLQNAIDLETPEGINSAVEAVGTQQPFFLACQGLNDRNLQKIYGEMVCKIMAKKYPHYAENLPMPYCNKATRIRVGIVSSLFHWHSVWKIPLSGWVLNLNKRFDLYCYHIGRSKDYITDIARKNCKRFVEDINFFEDLCHIIRNDNLHILLFPEIGMDPLTLKIATLRLAPVQCTTLGHPDTTGLPTIDYYLSSELMEPPDADEHYTEKLIRLPNLSFYYTPFDVPDIEINRKDFKLRHDAIVYLCSHALFTHLPQFDYVYPRIAQQVKNCQFVFISIKPYLTDKFYTRIAEAFKQHNLNPDEYLVILPRLDQNQYLKLNQLSDIFLDTISWSANNSTFEAIACNLPIVTLPGSLMRQRHCTGILNMMRVTDTIVSSIEDYIAMAIRLGKDTTFRSQISEKIATNKFRVYQDKACIEAFEKFIESVVISRS